MRAIQELQVELPAPPDGRSGVSGRPQRLVTILVGVLGGLFCAIVLSTLLAHPVGAAVVPGAEGTLPIAAIHDALPPAIPTVSAATTGAADAIVKPVVTAVIPQVTLAAANGDVNASTRCTDTDRRCPATPGVPGSRRHICRRAPVSEEHRSDPLARTQARRPGVHASGEEHSSECPADTSLSQCTNGTGSLPAKRNDG